MQQKIKDIEIAATLIQVDSDILSQSISLYYLLLQNSKIQILEDKLLREKILIYYYNNLSAGHYSVAKSHYIVSRSFFQKVRHANIAEHIQRCDRCLQHKSKYYRPYRELQSLEILGLDKLFNYQLIDFVTRLLVAQTQQGEVVDAMLVLVKRLSKQAIYVAVLSNINVEGLANVVERELITNYSTLVSIVTNRSTLFISKFQSALYRQQNTRRRLSTAQHP